MDIGVVKKFLTDSSIVYLNKDQMLYKSGATDNFVYIVLFGRLMMQVPNNADTDDMSNQTSFNLGRVNIGWTIGEEVLFDRQLQLRNESCYSETESWVLGKN